MWKRVNLALPHDATPIVCSQVAVHPWDAQYGHTTPDGCYLNPVNAIKSLADRLSGAGSQSDIIILMVCATSATEFAQQLDALSSVLPLPALKQTARRARTQISQATERMIIPATPQNGIPQAEPLAVSTLNSILTRTASADAMSGAGFSGAGEIKNALAAFREQREQHRQQMAEVMATPPAAVQAWAFVAQGDAVRAGADMLKNIPAPSSSLTYAHLFTGDLSGMMNWTTEV
ncbi:hypothetical protein KCE64_005398 [Salmonella enterica subsp. enterica serovar Hvittingfoss]|nr:hypothetical protein [Salmonella enterica subsp. enterica serovar Hvittingfoss]EHL2852847.1 hypothetical protein [Salmonella enterica subsp. enterica serovar Hvittingfoss]